VVVGGCSAGGLATLLNIDAVRAMLPPSARVRGLADAGYFLDSPDKCNAASSNSTALL
jgi:hypothetical protein